MSILASSQDTSAPTSPGPSHVRGSAPKGLSIAPTGPWSGAKYRPLLGYLVLVADATRSVGICTGSKLSNVLFAVFTGFKDPQKEIRICNRCQISRTMTTSFTGA